MILRTLMFIAALLLPAFAFAQDAEVLPGVPHDLVSTIITALMPVFLAGLAWLGVKLSSWISSQTENALVENALLRVQHLAFTVVKDLSQTVADAYKAAAADGKLTKDEAKAIKRTAVGTLKSYLGKKGLKELTAATGLEGGALDDFLGSTVESAVHDLRIERITGMVLEPLPGKS